MIINSLKKIKWFKKKISWDWKYRIGKWNFMGKEQLRYNAIVDLLKSCEIQNLRILDLGCGYGSLNDYLKNTEYEFCLGIDLSSNAISKAKKENYKNAKFLVADIHQFKTEEKFDVIIFNEVLYYLDNQMEIVEKYSSFLNEKGYFIFSFYGVREDLILKLKSKYELIKTEIVKQSENVFWGISLYKNK
jgi:2-polyprenyl-3-methyl-5-hydroxy-6-metoxy-1,4-benzoquinol methylase